MAHRLATGAIVGCLAAAAGWSAPAWGQAGFSIEAVLGPGQRVIRPGAGSCTIRVSARFDPADYAVSAVRFSVAAGDGAWSSPRVLPPLTLQQNIGLVVGPLVTGIAGGQMNFPMAGLYADPSNPIPTWEATWRTDDFRPRFVEFGTLTGRFDVYPERESPWSTSRLRGLTEGRLRLRVVPGPGALAVAVVLAGRRRRRRQGAA